MLVRAYLTELRLDAALAEADIAVRLNPYNAMVCNVMGNALSVGAARFDEAIPWFERAMRLNPMDPRQTIVLLQIGLAHLGAGRYENAERHLQDALRRQPDLVETRIALASALGSEIADGRETPPRGAEIGPSSGGAARVAVSAADGGWTTTTGGAAAAGGSPTTLTCITASAAETAGAISAS